MLVRLWVSVCLLLLATRLVSGYRVVLEETIEDDERDGELSHPYFEPYHPGFVGSWTNPKNHHRWRVNEGDPRSNTHPNIFEGVHPRQVCPNETAATEDGFTYCTHQDAGFCDKRSGTCLCFEGYQGVDCSDCRPTHYPVGDLCQPKVTCPADCSAAGECDFATGTCTCDFWRTGDDCSIPFCDKFDSLCMECDAHHCDRCVEGYFVASNNTCVSCSTHDPRCTVCDEAECFQCTDPLLTSVRRSGQRRTDPTLPFDEIRRELSDTNPHMNQHRTAYDEGERYYQSNDVAALAAAGFTRSTADTTFETYVWVDGAVPPPEDGDPLASDLRDLAVHCDQGLERDKKWHCQPWPVSHRVCGHMGVFSFSSPTYVILERALEVRITVKRSGGGLGRASVKYSLIHNTTDPSDVTPTQVYTSTQTLVFEHGTVRKSFLVAINDDNIPEAYENFRLELSEPTHGASLGNQWITQVVIIDDETHPDLIINPLNSSVVTNLTTVDYAAGEEAVFQVDTRDFVGRLSAAFLDDHIVAQVWDPASAWNGELGYEGGQGQYDYRDRQDGRVAQFDGTAAGDPRTSVIQGEVSDAPTLDGQWVGTIVAIKRATYELHVYHASRHGLRGAYFDNAYLLGNPVFQRKDHVVNHTWDLGRITQYGTDFVSVRWTGFVLAEINGDHTFHVDADDNVRLWVNHELLIDKWWSFAGDSFGTIFLTTGTQNYIRLEYRDRDGPAHCHLSWTPPGGDRHVIPTANLYKPDHIFGSPYTLNIKAGVANANVTGGGSVAFGAGLVAGVAGYPQEFAIYSRDRYGNDRLEEACTDVFRVLAVRDDGSGTGPGGVSDGIGVTEVPGRVTFNYDTLLHDVVWHPTIAGTYRLHVELWTDWRVYEPIYGSPFRMEIEPARTSAAESDAFGIGLASGVAGTRFNFTLVARDVLGNYRGVGGDKWDILAAHANESLGVAATCEDPAENGTYACHYVPLKDGPYALHVTLDGLHVRNSPYDVFVDWAPTNGHRCTATGPLLTDGQEGVPTYFDVHIFDTWDNPRYVDDVAPADVDVQLSGGGAGVDVGAATYLGDNTYRVALTPTWDGVRTLTVIVEGREITGSPFHPLIVPGAAFGPTTTANGTGLTDGVAGYLPWFHVQVRDTTGNEKITGEDLVVVNSTATRPTPGGPEEVHVSHVCPYTGASGIFTCTYNATVAATHVLTVTVNDQEIAGSPWSPLIVPAEMDPGTSVPSGSGLDYVIAGDVAPVYIRPVDVWGNDLLRAIDPTADILTARLVGTGDSGQGDFVTTGLGEPEVEVELPVTDFNNGTLWVGYTPEVSGQYSLTFDMVSATGLDATYYTTRDFLGEEAVQVDPVVDVDFGFRRPAPISRQGEEYSVRWEAWFRAAVSEVHEFFIDVTGNARLRIGGPGLTSLAQSGSGSTGTVRGTPVDGVLDLPGGVVLVDAFPATKPWYSAKIRLEAHLWYPVIVEFSDIEGVNGSIVWSYSTPTTPRQVVPTSQLYRAGSFPVALSPYAPLVVPAPASPPNCVAEGAGLHNAVSNITSAFVVHVRDRFNNSRRFWAGGDDVNVTAVRVGGADDLAGDPAAAAAVFHGTVVDLNNSFYQVTYVPQVSGVYALNVMVNPENVSHPDVGPVAGNESTAAYHIEGSPFTLVVGDDAGYGPTTTAFGHGRNDAMAGVEDHFQVQVRDVNGNNRTATDAVTVVLDLRPGQGQSLRGVQVYGRAVYAGGGLYDVYYTALAALYYDVTVLVNGEHAFESPYELFVVPAPADAPATDTRFVVDSTSVSGSDTYFTVFARDEFGNLRLDGGEEFVVRLYGTVTQHDNFRVTKGVVTDHEDGTYSVRYNVPEPGLYNIHVDLASDRRLDRGLLGEFFTNRWLFGEPRWTQVDPHVDFVFATPELPQLTRYASVFHSARWSGFIQAPSNGTYSFTALADDGARLFVDGELIIDAIDGEGRSNHTGVVSPVLTGDALYSITLEYTQLTGPAEVVLFWQWEDGLGTASNVTVVPTSALFSGATPIQGSPFTMNAS